MAPLRIGMIGLSASATTSWAANAHLPYLKATQKYAITALCNSSVAAAKSAIKAFDLPAGTKAYGNPNDLADDDEVCVFDIRTSGSKVKGLVVDSRPD